MTGVRKVVRRPLAEFDIVEIALYIENDSESAARRFLEAVQKTLLRIAAYPAAGEFVPAASDRLQGCQSWAVAGFENWRIYYQQTPACIEVVRVLHVARDLNAID